jgi:L-rhamnose mutarotase
MIRRAFTMRLKPSALAEYKRQHDSIWPELVAEIERSGIASITTFQRGLDLFLVSEIADEQAWDRLWNSEVHRRWAEVMEPLMHLRDDGIVDSGELVEVFHLRTPAGSAVSVAANSEADARNAHGEPHGNGRSRAGNESADVLSFSDLATAAREDLSTSLVHTGKLSTSKSGSKQVISSSKSVHHNAAKKAQVRAAKKSTKKRPKKALERRLLARKKPPRKKKSGPVKKTIRKKTVRRKK